MPLNRQNEQAFLDVIVNESQSQWQLIIIRLAGELLGDRRDNLKILRSTPYQLRGDKKPLKTKAIIKIRKNKQLTKESKVDKNTIIFSRNFNPVEPTDKVVFRPVHFTAFLCFHISTLENKNSHILSNSSLSITSLCQLYQTHFQESYIS